MFAVGMSVNGFPLSRRSCVCYVCACVFFCFLFLFFRLSHIILVEREEATGTVTGRFSRIMASSNVYDDVMQQTCLFRCVLFHLYNNIMLSDSN